MEYVIDVQCQEETCLVTATVLDENKVVLLEGKIELGVTDAEVAKQYAEEVFLPDLCRNFKKIETLVIEQPVAPESVIVENPPAE